MISGNTELTRVEQPPGIGSVRAAPVTHVRQTHVRRRSSARALRSWERRPVEAAGITGLPAQSLSRLLGSSI